MLIVVILLTIILVLLLEYASNADTQKKENFSLSKKPMEADNHLLNRNPFDDIDYITPQFYLRYSN